MGERRSLHKWLDERGLSSLKLNFDECGMDIVALKYMTRDELKEVVPATKMGLRIKMRVEMEQWQDKLMRKSYCRHFDDSSDKRKPTKSRQENKNKRKFQYESLESQSESELSSDKDSKSDLDIGTNDVADKDLIEEIYQGDITMNFTAEKASEVSKPNRRSSQREFKKVVSDEDGKSSSNNKNRNKRVRSTASDKISHNTKVIDLDPLIEVFKSEQEPHDVQIEQPSQPENAPFTQDLSVILNSTGKGRIVLTYSQVNNGCLSEIMRAQLLDCIIDYYFDNNKKMTSSDFEILSMNICSMFPDENPETYYEPRRSKNGFLVPAGKIYNKYHNKVGRYRKLGIALNLMK